MTKAFLLRFILSMSTKVAKIFAWAGSSAVKTDRTFIGDVRLAWASGVSVIEVTAPDGKKHLRIKRCDYQALFVAVDEMQLKVWKDWAAEASYERVARAFPFLNP